MIDQKENTGLAAGIGDDRRVVIGNRTSTEAKAEIENKTGNLKKKVSWYGALRQSGTSLTTEAP